MDGIFTRYQDISQPNNLLAGANANISGPPMLDNETFTHLTTFAEEDSTAQALTLAAQRSQTDMLEAVPTQNVTLDTRTTRWTITSEQDVLTTSADLKANLASALVVKLNTTRVRGSITLAFPGTATANDKYLLCPVFPIQGFSFGLRVGGNSTVVQDVATQEDQGILMSMEATRKNFTDQKVPKMIVGKPGFLFNPDGSNTFSVAGGGQVIVEFEMRPNCALFACEKAWAPSVPLQLTVRWTPTLLQRLCTPIGTAPALTSIQARVSDIVSDEIQLNAILTKHLQMHFLTSEATNMDLVVRNLAGGSAASQLFDQTFGMGTGFDMGKISAIYQYPVSRLATFTITGNSFDIFPVTNGSARPSMIVIKFPGNEGVTTDTTPNAETLYSQNIMSSLQLLYDGRTYFDQPLTAFQMYAETVRNIGGGYVADFKQKYFAPDVWNDHYCYIVLKTGPSHNDNDIQPARATQLELRGTLTAAIPAGKSILIHVGLFYDQTLLIMKNNTAISSLPIQ